MGADGNRGAARANVESPRVETAGRVRERARVCPRERAVLAHGTAFVGVVDAVGEARRDAAEVRPVDELAGFVRCAVDGRQQAGEDSELFLGEGIEAEVVFLNSAVRDQWVRVVAAEITAGRPCGEPRWSLRSLRSLRSLWPSGSGSVARGSGRALGSLRASLTCRSGRAARAPRAAENLRLRLFLGERLEGLAQPTRRGGSGGRAHSSDRECCQSSTNDLGHQETPPRG